jgi:hypothetical protein
MDKFVYKIILLAFACAMVGLLIMIGLSKLAVFITGDPFTEWKVITASVGIFAGILLFIWLS